MTSQPTTRADRRAAEIAARRRSSPSQRLSAQARADWTKKLAFGAIIAVVLAIGALLAFGDFLNRPAPASGQISIQSSMAGFTPSTITVKAGSTVSIDWWTQDAAPHLTNGVHTMVSTDLGLYEELPAESRKTITWTVPNTPGTYDVWCESCCGGKDAPQMHGKIVIQPADSAGDPAPAA